MPTSKYCTTWLEEITHFTAAGFTDHLASLVLCAYVTGCTIEQVLAAIEAGKALGDVPPAALRAAWKAAHDWAWIARRRGLGDSWPDGDRVKRRYPTASSVSARVGSHPGPWTRRGGDEGKESIQAGRGDHAERGRARQAVGDGLAGISGSKGASGAREKRPGHGPEGTL